MVNDIQMAPPHYSIFVGTFVHCKESAALEFLHNTAVIVDHDGKITHVGEARDSVGDYPSLPPDADVEVIRIKAGQFLFPGFIGMYNPAPFLKEEKGKGREAGCWSLPANPS